MLGLQLPTSLRGFLPEGFPGRIGIMMEIRLFWPIYAAQILTIGRPGLLLTTLLVIYGWKTVL